MRGLRAPWIAWTVALGLGPVARPSAAADAPWEWLRTHPAGPDEAKVAPSLPPDLAEVGRRALPSVVTLATTVPGRAPEEDAAEAGGFFVTEGGVVATSRQALARAAGRSLWVRPAGGRWLPAVPLATSWRGGVGVARVVATRRRFAPLRFGALETRVLGRPLVVVGPAAARRAVVSGAVVSSLAWFDPKRATGTYETPRGSGRTVDRAAAAIRIDFAHAIDAPGREGSPILDDAGACVGVVPGGGAPTSSAPASGVLAPLVARLAADGAWDPPDLGVRFFRAPVGDAGARPMPAELGKAREKEKGGALVADVALAGPAQAALWPFDVVLSVAGVPVFHETPESFVFATEALVDDLPADVVVLRGGRRQTLQVVPRRARAIYPDFAAEEEARASAFPP